jgi:BirA family biotin operon repressor/biotin-[acetyl-CoA-carboxylase] ligase
MATAQDADARLLRALRSGPGWLSLPALSGMTGLTPAQIEREIAGLRGAGFTIDTDAAGGCRLLAAPEQLIPADLIAGLPENQTVIGREILMFKETNSTNDLAAQAGADGLAEGLVIFAEKQRAGRGRLGRSWQSPPRQGLWFSVLLRPTAPVDFWPELTFCAALAVAEAAEAETGCAATIKWPNDVLIAGRKVCGILLESHQARPPGFVVIGIGLNVRQQTEDFAPELRERATSLRLAAGGERNVSRRSAAIAVLARLEHHYGGWPANGTEIQRFCHLRGSVQPATLPTNCQWVPVLTRAELT